jgi:hypothetical protein
MKILKAFDEQTFSAFLGERTNKIGRVLKPGGTIPLPTANFKPWSVLKVELSSSLLALIFQNCLKSL